MLYSNMDLQKKTKNQNRTLTLHGVFGLKYGHLLSMQPFELHLMALRWVPVITDLQSAVLPHTLVNCCSIGHSIIPSGFTQPVYKNEQPTLSVGTGTRTLVPKTIKYGHLYCV